MWASWFLFSMVMAGAAVRGGGFLEEGVNRLHWSVVIAYPVWVILRFVPGEGSGESRLVDSVDEVPGREERLLRLLSLVVQSLVVVAVITTVGTLVTRREAGAVLPVLLGASWMLPYLIATLLLAVFCLLSPVRVGGRPRARRKTTPTP
ncbi:hypothetical protein FNQ90_10480 [Streptomyces alkaliphilus]|uniref:Uncharacterized protein n=1 Tax=Streptomyces alkaliphilus TaxID=1472722 RepID=A0A7W3TCV1_9ACTN|nr:hypothetical protein [Streptomyces alkaliphilus]MBB0244519.1 hypothetical protein [Streptomyces alkaliphilus]